MLKIGRENMVMALKSRIAALFNPIYNFTIVGQVGENTMLDVEEFRSDWSKVKLRDGSSGWVQNMYTSVIPPGAQG